MDIGDVDRTKDALQHAAQFLVRAAQMSAMFHELGLNLDDTVRPCGATLASATTLGMDLDDLVKVYGGFNSTADDAAADATFRHMLVIITGARRSVDNFKRDAYALEIAANEAIGALNSALPVFERRLQRDRTELAQSEAKRDEIAARLRRLQEEMSGWSGLWRWMQEMSGTSALILELAEVIGERDAIVEQQRIISHNIARAAADGEALAHTKATLVALSGLYAGTVALLNTMQKFSELAARAERDERAELGASSGTVAAYFHARFAADIQDLSAWRRAF